MGNKLLLAATLAASLGIAAPTLAADTTFQMWPSAQYLNSIPTHKELLGYNAGERITSHSDMVKYFEALQQAAPKRIKLFKFGETWEGRELIYAVIGSEENLMNLDEYVEGMAKLSDPRVTSKSAAQKLIDELPSSVWLEHGVHGNEISSTDAAMMTAYHLLAATNVKMNKTILDNTLVFIDPLQNPDGRARFVSRYYSTVGAMHSDDRLSAEHNEPWPRGRSNHYLFDMNRDWLAITQPETAARVKLLNKYKPTVVIDLHEMGSDSSYFFVPSAQPINPYMQEGQLDNSMLIGKNNAKYFDQFGFSYFTREVFDAFYPGYGDSWPTFYGASAATYEVASARGERIKTADGEILTYQDTVQRHFVASMATAEATALNREKILTDFYQYQVNAIAAGKNDDEERVYILPNERDRAGTHRLATLMAEHGVEVKQASESFKACGTSYKEGAYIIDTAQPRGLFVKTTFTEQVDMAAEFIKEQERRRANKLRDQIYDVTGWSLPLMFNVDTDHCGRAVSVDGNFISADTPLLADVSNIDAKVAYIVPWGDMSAGRFLTAALRAGIKVKSADQAFKMEAGRFPAGSLIIEVAKNDADLPTIIASLANETGAKVVGVDSSWVTEGPSFGSGNTVTMKAPKVAMAWDEPTSSLSAGNTRFVIEQQFNYPVTGIRANVLSRANLSDYQVLILPSGYYAGDLGAGGAQNIKDWVQKGGVLITLADATQWAASESAGLLDVAREYAVKEEGASAPTADGDDVVAGTVIKDKAGFIDMIENDKDMPDYVAGILANVEVDQEHWLTAGVNQDVVAMIYGNDVYSPIKLASGKNVAWFKGKDEVMASGYIWDEFKSQIAYKPYLIHQPMGRGMVIAFTQEPATRAYLDGLNVMLMNTIFRGAAHARPLP
ncbi:M14 family metallopeptidase [Alteromonas gilva]|uniref:M14 family metallopeptidase n=1 Tax=Alteromonas gilva TaxID=2987522 RepID=A0ABT5KWM1_9ALTE|nr:M14 family metallopeptidase [Alteromonas gilva]MDC8829155.1 M14 family metallopeptidase [Alteromonas gilva]